jgi:hypothetical protein
VPKDNVSEGKKMRIDEKSYLIFMVEGCYVSSQWLSISKGMNH